MRFKPRFIWFPNPRSFYYCILYFILYSIRRWHFDHYTCFSTSLISQVSAVLGGFLVFVLWLSGKAHTGWLCMAPWASAFLGEQQGNELKRGIRDLIISSGYWGSACEDWKAVRNHLFQWSLLPMRKLRSKGPYGSFHGHRARWSGTMKKERHTGGHDKGTCVQK